MHMHANESLIIHEVGGRSLQVDGSLATKLDLIGQVEVGQIVEERLELSRGNHICTVEVEPCDSIID